jgi:excisionase family DNA binding protein
MKQQAANILTINGSSAQCKTAESESNDGSNQSGATVQGVNSVAPGMLERNQRSSQIGDRSMRSSSRVYLDQHFATNDASARILASGHSESETQPTDRDLRAFRSSLPITVQEAARFLGVSPQTVYLWVERKQIPHFRMMGRNIRFLLSDLRPFRAQFKQEVENGETA